MRPPAESSIACHSPGTHKGRPYGGIWFVRWPAVNPIFLRVMNTSGRQARHVWVRVLYLVIILLVLMVMMMTKLFSYSGEAALAELGETLFRTVSFAQVLLILLLAPIYTAGAISQERDAQTFSVLLATPLSNLQIVLGSLLSRLFFVLAILFSTLPIFALLYYFGGFELRDLFLSYGIAASSALLTGAVAVAISIISSGTRRVIVGFFLFIVGYVVGLWLLDHTLLANLLPGWRAGALDWLHPLGAIQSTVSAGEVVRPLPAELGAWDFLVWYPEYGYLMLSLGLSLVILVLSAVLVRRLARGYGGLAARLCKVALIVLALAVVAAVCYLLVDLRGLAGGLTAFIMVAVVLGVTFLFFLSKRRKEPRSVWDNPIAWRERFTRTATGRQTVVQFLYILLSILALYVVLVLKVAGARAEDARMFVLVVVLAQMFGVIMVGATLAASSVSTEREQGTLDILLATPITPRYFLYGKLVGIIRYLGLFLAMMLLVTLGSFLIARLPVEVLLTGLVPKGWVEVLGRSGSAGSAANPIAWANWPWASILHPLVVTAGLAAAMVTVGMTLSLRAKKTATAAILAALAVVGVAGAMTCCCLTASWIPVVGPIAAMGNPFLAAWACLMPEAFTEQFKSVHSEVLGAFHSYFGLHLGALAAAGGYFFFAWQRMRTLVRQFDQQTRQKV